MPIKVRCKACETVLTFPDQAAGKVSKCKQCGERVRIPVPKGDRPKAKARPVEEESEEDPYGGDSYGDPLANLDLGRMEDTKRRVCPGCATPVHLDDVECPKCGVTIATGTLSERQRLKHERKGPPPAEFYGAIWKNGGKFLKNHWSYAVRTGLIWSLTLTMSMTCLVALSYYMRTRSAQLLESAKADTANIEISGDELIITVPKEKGSKVEYDKTFYLTPGEIIRMPAPHKQPLYEPPAWFWIFLTVVFQLGFGGWAWTLAITIAKLTLAGEKRIKRFPMDFFGNLTMGFRFYVWPSVLLFPFLMLVAPIGIFSPVAAGIINACLLLIPLLVLPAAVIHMTQNYQYRGWLIWWMAKDFFKTMRPSLYISMLNLFMVLLVPLAVGITVIVMNSQISAYLLTQQAAALAWAKANIMDMGEGNFEFMFYQMPLVFTFFFIVFLIICGLMAGPAVFMMRVIGLYGVYFKPDLTLVNEFPDLQAAGFGPRFLAYLIDQIILTLLALVGGFVGTLFGMLFNFYGWGDLAVILSNVIRTVATLGLWGFYFSSGESGAARSTLGKAAIGIMVLGDNDKPLTRKQAWGRAASAFVTSLTFYIGFLMCFFRADKKTMHDLMSKSKVVWRGEES